MIETSRRNLLAGAAGVGAAAVLAACSSNSSDTGSAGSANNNTGGQAANSTGAQAAPTTGQPAGGQQAGGQQAAGTAIKKADIPVGGGKVFQAQGVVVTQPTAGQFKAFSVICTHAGCPVNKVANGTINCPCHGSRFSIVDGSVKGGPAPAPLKAKNVTVSGDSLTVA